MWWLISFALAAKPSVNDVRDAYLALPTVHFTGEVVDTLTVPDFHLRVDAFRELADSFEGGLEDLPEVRYYHAMASLRLIDVLHESAFASIDGKPEDRAAYVATLEGVVFTVYVPREREALGELAGIERGAPGTPWAALAATERANHRDLVPMRAAGPMTIDELRSGFASMPAYVPSGDLGSDAIRLAERRARVLAFRRDSVWFDGTPSEVVEAKFLGAVALLGISEDVRSLRTEGHSVDAENLATFQHVFDEGVGSWADDFERAALTELQALASHYPEEVFGQKAGAVLAARP